MRGLVLVLFAAVAGSPPARAPSAPAGPGGPAAMPSIPTQGRVLWIPIRGEIDLGLAPFVERALRGARPSDVVVLDINTFGGRLDAAVRIRDALLQTRARTVAFINRRAISAGALIALATDVIAMRPGATLGAATPVQAGAGGEMRPVEAKVVSPKPKTDDVAKKPPPVKKPKKPGFTVF